MFFFMIFPSFSNKNTFLRMWEKDFVFFLPQKIKGFASMVGLLALFLSQKSLPAYAVA